MKITDIRYCAGMFFRVLYMEEMELIQELFCMEKEQEADILI